VTTASSHDAVAIRPGILPPTWPLWALLPGMGLWWGLGLSPIARPAIGVLMWISLLMRRVLRLPPGFTIWMLFLGFAAVSVLQLPVGRMLPFGLRFAEYLTITAVLLYAYNLPRTVVTDRDVLRIFMAFWLVVVTTGWVAVFNPQLILPSFGQLVLPRALIGHEYAQQLTTPYVAQIHYFLGYPLARPAAPFPYATGWGSAVGLLFPFVICAIGALHRGRFLLIVSSTALVPMVMSVNRGMTASIVAAATALMLMTRDPRLRRRLRLGMLFAIPALVGAILLSPLGEVVEDRIDNPHSNTARFDLASQASALVRESPWIGHGTTVAYDGNAVRPPVGTQGLLWTLLVFHGVPATALFITFFGVAFRRCRGASFGIWTRASIVAAAVQLPFYGLMSGQAVFLMAAVGIAMREMDEEQG
jgi:polysaccharide biosynthesis protein PslJ